MADTTFSNGTVILPAWLNDVNDRVYTDIVNVKNYGAVGDGSTDDHAAVIDAVEAAITRLAASGGNSITVFFPSGTYVLSSWLPVVTGILYACSTRWSATLKFTGTTGAFASATYSAGTFTDNLDDTISEHEINRTGIVNLYIEHTGAISGNAPSGTAWAYLVHLVNCPHTHVIDVGADGKTNNIGAINLKWCWRAQVVRPWITRGGAYSGGVGIYLDSQTNAVLLQQPFVYGDWTQGIVMAGNSGTLLEPNVEFTTVGVLLLGVSNRVIGGYLEGNGTDIQVGVSGGTSADRWKVEGTWHNGSSSTYGINMSYAIRGEINDPYFTGTYSTSKFASTTSASENYGNVIEITVASAAAPGLAGLGLIGGRNIIRCYGEDFDDYRNYAEYQSRTGNALEAAYGPITIGVDQVVGTRKTGWTAATGTATRTTYATSTVTLPQLAERVKALTDDLISHGLIGT